MPVLYKIISLHSCDIFVNLAATCFPIPSPVSVSYTHLDVYKRQPVSAARLNKINDFYYLEALETPPQYRKKGYASELLNEMITHLHQQGSVDIRDCVSKTNTASLATHKKCGFFIAEENGIYYPSNTVNNKTYGMRYFIR